MRPLAKLSDCQNLTCLLCFCRRQTDVQPEEMCLLSTLALALGCLAGAALAVAFTELAIVVAGFVAGGFVGYLIFAAFLS